MAYFDKYGVEFTDDRKTLVSCPEYLEGEYIIPDGVRYIDEGAFCYSKITSVTMPNTVESIGRMAFDFCLNLNSICIPKSVIRIDEMAFYECKNLTSLIVDDKNPNFCSIDNVLFDKHQTTLIKCPNIIDGTYRIPETVMKISKGAFEGCDKITSIEIPCALTTIDEMAFSNCSSIGAFNVDEGNLSFISEEGVLYSKDRTELVLFPNKFEGEYSIPYGVTTIKSCAFDACKKLTSLTMPNSITKVEGGCLLGSIGPDTMEIPEGKSLRFEIQDGRIKSSALIDINNADKHASTPININEFNVEVLREVFDVKNVEADKKLRKDIGELNDETLKILGEIFGSK